MITSKIGQDISGWNALGAVCIGLSMLSLILFPQHTTMHRLAVAALGTGSMLMSVGSRMFLPCLCLASASIMGAMFGYTGIFRFPILTVASFGGLMIIYEWWKDRQAKTIAKRQIDRP